MQSGCTYDEIGNTVKAGSLGVSGAPMHSFVADDRNFHTQRTWGNTVEIVGTAVTNATVTVSVGGSASGGNGIRADRQETRFRALVPVENAASAVQTNITAYAVRFDGTVDVVADVGGSLYVPQATETVSHRPSGTISRDSRFTYDFDRRGRLARVTSRNASPKFKLECMTSPHNH